MRVAYCRHGSGGWPSPGGPHPGWSVTTYDLDANLEDRLRDHPFDVALLRAPDDVQGLGEILSRLRVAAPGVPVVIVVSGAHEAEAAAAVAAGAADYWLDGMSPLRLRTSLEQAAQRRRAGSAQLARDEALERVDDAVVVTDVDERIVYWNNAASRLYGYAYGEVVGRLLPDTLSPHWLDAEARLKAWRTLAARGVWLGEATHAREDGPAVRVEVELTLVRDGRGRQSGILMVARPAATAAAAAAAVVPGQRDPRDARAFFERILNSVADPIFVKDRGHRLILVNDAHCALLGRPREELLGHSDLELLPAAQAEVFNRQDNLVFETGEENVNEELITDAKGETHVLVTKKTLARDAEGRPILVGVIRDVTAMANAVDDLKRSQEQLRHAQKLEAIGRLAGGVAHDFNNILTAIVGCAGLMLDGLPPGHPVREDAEEIHRAGEQAASLTRQLLTFSRREQGAPRAVDLRELCGGMRKMLQRLLPADIELELTLPDRLGAVRMDAGHAEQVLLNLVVNAGDAMPEGGRIEVVLEDAPEGGGGLAGPCVRLTVTDTGVGMDEATRARIFDPFFTTKSTGTGLGLATVRDVVAQSGGAVIIESAPGRGTSFYVFWPRCADSPEAPRAETSMRAAPRRANVLIVEDDDAVRRFAVRCLERAGYDVLTAADGPEAIRLSDSHEGQFDVVILDMVLPRMRGTDVFARLRARQPTAQVLFVSGYRTEEESLPRGLSGRAAFLQKPFTAALLVERVHQLVAASRPG
jgi:two-component system cell cycle sensor histidine kinase/response regulator CckA